MVKFFDYDNYKLTFAEGGYHILLIKEFKAIWDKDKTKDKTEAFKMFTYIYLMLDWQSPYADYESDEEKHNDSKADSSLKETTIKTKLMQEALQKYDKILKSNRLLRLIDSITVGIDKYETYFKTVNFTEKIESGASKGKLLHDPKTFMTMIEKSDIVITKVKELIKQTKQEVKEDQMGLRGGKEEGVFEY